MLEYPTKASTKKNISQYPHGKAFLVKALNAFILSRTVLLRRKFLQICQKCQRANTISSLVLPTS